MDEAPSRDIRKIDGMWSPWSTLNSPCINLKVLKSQRVDNENIYRVVRLVDF